VSAEIVETEVERSPDGAFVLVVKTTTSIVPHTFQLSASAAENLARRIAGALEYPWVNRGALVALCPRHKASYVAAGTMCRECFHESGEAMSGSASLSPETLA
jgi:hypothetical protein